jgi:hypothetical protein
VDHEALGGDDGAGALLLRELEDRLRDGADELGSGLELGDEDAHALVGVDADGVEGDPVADDGDRREEARVHDADLLQLEDVDEVVRGDGGDEADGREAVDDRRPPEVDLLELVDRQVGIVRHGPIVLR